MIDWKEAARHYRFHMMMADEQERRLKRRLWHEHEQRVSLVNTLSDVLASLAPITLAERCRGCGADTAFVEHATGCWYLRLLEAVAEAGKSVEG